VSSTFRVLSSVAFEVLETRSVGALADPISAVSAQFRLHVCGCVSSESHPLKPQPPTRYSIMPRTDLITPGPLPRGGSPCNPQRGPRFAPCPIPAARLRVRRSCSSALSPEIACSWGRWTRCDGMGRVSSCDGQCEWVRRSPFEGVKHGKIGILLGAPIDAHDPTRIVGVSSCRVERVFWTA